MSEYKLTPGKIGNAVIGAYQKVEDTVVGAYKKVEGAFVDTFLEKVEEPAKPETEVPQEEEK